jgi:hypothetical protein
VTGSRQRRRKKDDYGGGGGSDCWYGPERCQARRDNGPAGVLAKLKNAIWPTALAICSCGRLYAGTLGDCLLRGALDRARQGCGVSMIGCRNSGAGYFACVGSVCAGSVYVGFFNELWDFVGQYC